MQVIEKQHRMMEQLGSQIQVFISWQFSSALFTFSAQCVWVIVCLCLQCLEQQIAQEDNSSQALRGDVLAKEQNVLELHRAMKEVR